MTLLKKIFYESAGFRASKPRRRRNYKKSRVYVNRGVSTIKVGRTRHNVSTVRKALSEIGFTMKKKVRRKRAFVSRARGSYYNTRGTSKYARRY